MSVARYWPVLLWATMAIAAEAPENERRPALTIKERLSGKAADQQRVNDCKVPIEKRDSKKPRADCRDGRRQ